MDSSDWTSDVASRRSLIRRAARERGQAEEATGKSRFFSIRREPASEDVVRSEWALSHGAPAAIWCDGWKSGILQKRFSLSLSPSLPQPILTVFFLPFRPNDRVANHSFSLRPRYVLFSIQFD